jgi:uncharacterized RDD family membrane protein YckC
LPADLIQLILNEVILKKKPEEFALEYAGFWIRLGASIVDIIFLLVILYTVYCTISGFSINTGLPHIPPIVLAVFFWLICSAYLIGFWAWKGQTPGKLLLGIKIIRTDSSPLDWQHALQRYLGCIASTVVLCIGFIVIAFDSRKQGWHDRIADTYVVKVTVRQVSFTQSYAGGELG